MLWGMADASPQDPWVPPNTFGARLAQIRQAKGWNVKQAALHCGIPEASWHNWEDGKTPRDYPEKAQQIAKAVPCDYVWLATGGSTSVRKANRTLRGLPSQKNRSYSSPTNRPALLTVVD